MGRIEEFIEIIGADQAGRQAPAILPAGTFRSGCPRWGGASVCQGSSHCGRIDLTESALRALPAAGRIPRPAATPAGILLAAFFPPVAPIAASQDRTDAGLRGTFHMALAGFQAAENRPGRAVLRWPSQAVQHRFNSCFAWPRVAVWPRSGRPVFRPSEAPKALFGTLKTPFEAIRQPSYAASASPIITCPTTRPGSFWQFSMTGNVHPPTARIFRNLRS